MIEFSHILSWAAQLLHKLWHDFSQRFEIDRLSACLVNFCDSLLIIFGAGLALWLVQRWLRRLGARVERRHGAHRGRKVATISSLIYSTLKYTIYIAAALWILARWGVDTTSLTVGTAVFGAALGFGSQGLVQDMITGLSILAEDQLAVGDFVEITDKAGVVEEVGLRVVKLRDTFGTQHVIFNRTISTVSNYSTGGIQALVDVSLENPAAGEAAQRVAARVCRDLAAEVPYFTRVPEIEGVHQSSTQDVFLRLKVRVLPKQEQVIGTLFTGRLKCAFAAEKIVIPEDRIRVIILSDLFCKAAKAAPPAG